MVGRGEAGMGTPPQKTTLRAPLQSPSTLPEGVGAVGFPAVVAFPLKFPLQDLQGFIGKEAWGGKKKDLGTPPPEEFGGVLPPHLSQGNRGPAYPLAAQYSS